MNTKMIKQGNNFPEDLLDTDSNLSRAHIRAIRERFRGRLLTSYFQTSTLAKSAAESGLHHAFETSQSEKLSA